MKHFFRLSFLLLLLCGFYGLPMESKAETAASENSIGQLFKKKKNKKKYLTHTVNVGESLLSILERYGVPLSVMLENNPQLLTRDLVRGEQLKIDKSAVNTATSEQIRAEMAQGIQHFAERASQAVDESDLKNKQPEMQIAPGRPVTEVALADTTEQSVSPAPKTQEKGQEYIEHTVVPGETLFSLSRQYKVTVPDIRFANPEALKDGLKAGSVIRIPVAVSETESEFVEYEGLADQNKYDTEGEEIRKPVKNFDTPGTAIQVSLLLPMTDEGKQADQFTELYQGLLLALDSLKREGISIQLELFDTQRSLEKVNSIIASGALASSDLIIGPVYEKEFCEVAAYAKSRAIPIVSPLAAVGCENPYIFQMAPIEEHRWDKAKTFLQDKNVVFYESSQDDKEFVNQIKAIVPPGYKTRPFDPKEKPEEIGEILESDKETVFIVAPETEQLADAMLSKLSAIKKTAFSPKPMSVFGSSKFARMSALDPAYFFLLNLRYITSYHVDRTNEEVLRFDSNYIKTFGAVPSLYSYRGYDIAMFFIGSLKEFGSDFYTYIDDYYTTILQVRYKFHRPSPDEGFKNEEWMMVNYTPSYNIIVQ